MPARSRCGQEVIAIDQDTLGKPATKVSDSSPGGLEWTQVWARPLANGDVAALMFNRGSWGGCYDCPEAAEGCACQGLDFAQIATALKQPAWATANVSVRFVWNHSTAPGVYSGKFPPASAPSSAARLRPHESLLVRLRMVHGGAAAEGEW